MNKPTYIDTKQCFFSGRVHREATRRKAGRFAKFTDHAVDAAAGIETLAGILLCDGLDRESDSDQRTLSPQDVTSLLGLIKFAAKSLRLEACGLNDWAEAHFVQEAEQ